MTADQRQDSRRPPQVLTREREGLNLVTAGIDISLSSPFPRLDKR